MSLKNFVELDIMSGASNWMWHIGHVLCCKMECIIYKHTHTHTQTYSRSHEIKEENMFGESRNTWQLRRMERKSFIHSVFCLTTGPKSPPKWFLHIVRSRTSSIRWEYPLLSLRSSSSFLRLPPSLLVTSISPFIFPSIACLEGSFYAKFYQSC